MLLFFDSSHMQVPQARPQGFTAAWAGTQLYVGSVTKESAWTLDTTWSRLFLLGYRPSDDSVTMKAILGKAGVNDHLDEITVS